MNDFNPTEQMQVDLHTNGSMFLVRCPLWANEIIRDVPSRRWSKSARAWTVPVLRQNVEAVRRIMQMPGVHTTVRAKEAVNTYQDKIDGMRRNTGGFPSWYKFKRPPRAHQQRALDKGYGLRAFALFMDMQTGKSKTAIDLTTAHRMEGHIDGTLILTKLSLRGNWLQVLADDCPIPYSAYLPYTDREREFDQWLDKPHDYKVMIVGWESLSAGGMIELCRRFMAYPRRAIIGDETTFISGHKAQRSLYAVELAKAAAYRYALTGTPAAEGPMNLYMQFEYLDPNIIGIGDFLAFRNRYAIMGGFMRPVGNSGKKVPTQIVGYQDLDELTGIIAPHSFQVLKKDAYDLPPKRYKRHEVQITDAQRAMYRKVKSEGVLAQRDGSEMILQNVLEVALRLHQITGGYGVTPREHRYMGLDKDRKPIEKVKTIYEPYAIVTPDKNPKIQELLAVTDEAKHKQGIIWVVYQHEIAAITEQLRLRKLRIGELHGKIAERDRQPMVNEFNKGNLQWVVANAATGGMGFPMMASEVNIFYNNTFKNIDRAQAEDRAYGDGQTKSGIWIDIIGNKTVDALIMAALAQKQDLSDFIKHRIGEAIKLLDGEL